MNGPLVVHTPDGPVPFGPERAAVAGTSGLLTIHSVYIEGVARHSGPPVAVFAPGGWLWVEEIE